MATPRLMLVFCLAVLGVVIIIAALATESWWALPFALLAHLTGTALAVGAIGKTLGQQDKPDPVTETRRQEGERAEQEGDGDDRDEPRMAI